MYVRLRPRDLGVRGAGIKKAAEAVEGCGGRVVREGGRVYFEVPPECLPSLYRGSRHVDYAITVKLDGETYNALVEYARQRRVSKSAVVREALRRYLGLDAAAPPPQRPEEDGIDRHILPGRPVST